LTDGYRIPLFDANAGDHARSCCFDFSFTIPAENAEEIGAPLSGNIWKVMVLPHQKINEGDVLVNYV
jgi:biotin carboxyl carrier protein